MKIYSKEFFPTLAVLKKEMRWLIVLLFVLLMPLSAHSQKIAVKTNALEWVTMSPNVAAEFVVSPSMSLDLSASFNKWIPFANAKFDHLKIQPELRYWFQRPMAQHFLGLTLLYIDYDMMNKGVCLDGQAIGAGLSYGYNFVLTKRWNLELTAGVGAAYCFEKKYNDGAEIPVSNNANGWRVVPIKLGVTVSYVIF